MKKKIVNVAVPVALKKTFGYLTEGEVFVGNVVNITFRNVKTFGLVVDVCDIEDDEIEKSDFKLKYINEIVNLKPLSGELMNFVKWVADYNLIPIGLVFKFIFSEKFINKTTKLSNTYAFGNDENKKITEKQQNVVEFLKSDKNNSYFYEELKQFCSLNVIKTLVKNGVLIEKQEEFRKYDYTIKDIKLNVLSAEQDVIFNNILSYIQKDRKPILLEGATGSGKTEIYFHLFEKMLNDNKDNQILFLLPEIALTSQFIDRIKSQFICKDVAIWHSNISDCDKRNIWKGILDGSIKIVVGARSSLFLPFNKLSLIVVDEEHDLSYKQVDNGCYNARDMAIVRAKINNCSVILGSATPSLESLINVDSGKYNYVYLKNRFGNSVKPIIEIVDLTKEKIKSGKYLSNRLVKEIQEELDKKNQVLLFMNRRGYSPIAICRECGYKFTCKKCSASLTVHKKTGEFVCHQCGYKIKETTTCPDCGAENSIIYFGPGVEKIEEEVKTYFPDKNIAVITSDTIQNISKIKEIISKIINGEIDIIIGTQMITKGYDFPKLTLVGVLDADASLFGANFRASERTYQLLTQVIGRAGRREVRGRALIQTYSPENVIIQALKNNDKDVIMNFERENRELMGLPPYGKLVMISVSGKKENEVYKKIKEIANLFPVNDKITLYGPTQMNIYKLNNEFRFRILIKTDNCVNIQKLVAGILDGVKINSSLKVKVDVNPYFVG